MCGIRAHKGTNDSCMQRHQKEADGNTNNHGGHECVTRNFTSRTRNYTVTFWRTLEESRKGLGSVSLKINNQHTH